MDRLRGQPRKDFITSALGCGAKKTWKAIHKTAKHTSSAASKLLVMMLFIACTLGLNTNYMLWALGANTSGQVGTDGSMGRSSVARETEQLSGVQVACR